jgi:hypothetical protein
MDISKLKISLGLLVAILLQGGGFVWWLSGLNSTLTYNTQNLEIVKTEYVEEIKEFQTLVDEQNEIINDLNTQIQIMTNEYRTIMTDHKGFGEVLKELSLAGLLPTGEKRDYGNYE